MIQVIAITFGMTVAISVLIVVLYRKLERQIDPARFKSNPFVEFEKNSTALSYYKHISDEIRAVKTMVEDKQIEQDYQIGDHVKVNGEVWKIDSIEKNEELGKVTGMILTGKKSCK